MKRLILLSSCFVSFLFLAPIGAAYAQQDANGKSQDELAAAWGLRAPVAQGPWQAGRNQRVPIRGGKIILDEQPVAKPAADEEQAAKSCSITFKLEFELGSSRVDSRFIPDIQNIAGVLKRYPDVMVEVIGHTDSQGFRNLPPSRWADQNLTLSQMRSAAVRAKLVEFGVSPERTLAVGKGQFEPREGLVPEDSRNRRVEFKRINCKSEV